MDAHPTFASVTALQNVQTACPLGHTFCRRACTSRTVGAVMGHTTSAKPPHNVRGRYFLEAEKPVVLCCFAKRADGLPPRPHFVQTFIFVGHHRTPDVSQTAAKCEGPLLPRGWSPGLHF